MYGVVSMQAAAVSKGWGMMIESCAPEAHQPMAEKRNPLL